MRHTFLIAASLVVLGFASSVFAAGAAEDAAYDKNKGVVIDSRGNCVRTQWHDVNDPCAPAPAPKPAPRPVAKAAPKMPTVSREASTLYFDFNKATLTAESKGKLDKLATIINDSSAINNVTIHGYTDQFGTDTYNEALANKRVAAAKEYLDSKSRLKAEGDIRGLGKANPEEGCATIKKRAAKIACMAKERRVEIEFNAQK